MYGSRELPRLDTAAYRERVTKLVEEQLAGTAEDLERVVREQITDVVSQIVPALLGLRCSFGEWSVSHHDRESHQLGGALRQSLTAQAEAVVEEALKDWEPTKAMIKTVRAEYAEQMEYLARDAAGRAAAQDAREWAETFVNDVLDGKLDGPGAPDSARAVLRDIAEGKLKGAKAKEAAAAIVGKEK